MMRPLLTLCLMLLTSSVIGLPQERSNPNDEKSTVLSLEILWNQAEQSKDAKALNQLLGSTLTYIDETGLLMDKSEFLVSVTRTSLNSDQIFNEGMTAKRYGDVILVTGAYREKGVEKGKSFVKRGRFTDVWAKQTGIWQCVSSQTTLLLK
jgi:ketosteroid isomerase-like protein